jgi:AhpD family alkylhydroperoxidase
MNQHLDHLRAAPQALNAVIGFANLVATSGLEPSLLHLINIRVSQLNDCLSCVAMHEMEAQADGETAERLGALDNWREAPFFARRERAALEWAEAVTVAAESLVPHDVYTRARDEFDEEQLVALTIAVFSVNAWSRPVVR